MDAQRLISTDCRCGHISSARDSPQSRVSGLESFTQEGTASYTSAAGAQFNSVAVASEAVQELSRGDSLHCACLWIAIPAIDRTLPVRQSSRGSIESVYRIGMILPRFAARIQPGVHRKKPCTPDKLAYTTGVAIDSSLRSAKFVSRVTEGL